MGSCVSSIHKSRAESAMKQDMKSLLSNKDSLLVPESTIPKVKVHDDSVDLPIRTLHTNRDSKEEMFFDSQAWLGSDCEDDFFSVKGDFTPSCGSTPVHHSLKKTFSSTEDKPRLSMTEPSPTKKRLSDLFRESVREQQVVDESDNATALTNSASSGSQKTPNISYIHEREKSIKLRQCCLLPSSVSCRSFSIRKKKISPPVIAVTGEAY